ncbi:MAG: hypothetical protein L6R38_005505 [Xanthoria sp. 2 TBL-2021]|nr:MAG: hypothetical protein L6R38_005505 [Xanthoria sp. 2 TBL-2021]
MAELALVINIIETVKLTYQVAHYVHEIIQSARNEDMERKQISSNFKLELLFLASFKRYFEKAQGAIAYDQALDELWLLEIEQVIGHLKRDFFEYEDYASKDGSKSLGGSTSSLPLLTKPTTSRSSSTPKVDASAEEESSSMSQKLRDGQSKIYRKAKWALFDRQHLRNIVEKFQKRNKTLRKILQFAMAGILQQIAQHGQGFNSLQQDQDAVALGLTTWAEIRQIKDQPERIDKDFSIGNCTVSTTEDASIIRLGTLCTTIQKAHFAPEGSSGANSQDLDERIGQRVNQLANLLSTAGSNALGTLPFRGFLKEPNQLRYAFVFDMPDATTETKPDSLHHMIESPVLGRLWSLSDRFNLAVDLSKTIGTFHMFGWVLKGFQSSSVVFCYDEQTTKPQLGRPYIAGFEYIRPVSSSTVGQPLDMSEKTTLYCHPDVQDEPNIEFAKIHDLYSLGVVLLEIGLWLTARQILQQARPPRPSKPGEIREEYVRKANSKLPLRMGKAYTEAVVACLESRHKYQAIKPDIFLNVFDKEIVQKLSAKRLLG